MKKKFFLVRPINPSNANVTLFQNFFLQIKKGWFVTGVSLQDLMICLLYDFFHEWHFSDGQFSYLWHLSLERYLQMVKIDGTKM